MATQDISSQIEALEKSIFEQKQELAKLRKQVEPQAIKDYILQGQDGVVQLSKLFGDKKEMILIFNMGKSCSYCTLWADGLNGLSKPLADRAAFIVTSPDSPEVQKAFAGSRGWTFPMYSHKGSALADDLNFTRKHEGKAYVMPGVISLSKEADGTILHHQSAYFGPGDSYCVQWDLLNLLPKGVNEWQPKYDY